MLMFEEEGRLVERAKAGDRSAFDALFRAHFEAVKEFLLPYLHWNLSDVEDVVQDTFLVVLDGLEGFRGEASFRTWVFRIARNRALNYARDRKAGVPLQPDHPSPDPDPSEVMAQADDPYKSLDIKGLLHIAKDVVSETEYNVLVMSRGANLKNAVVAQNLGMAEGTVAHHLHEAFRKLRKYFSSKG